MSADAPGATQALSTLASLSDFATQGAAIIRREVAPPFGHIRRVPLIPGTEGFAGPWLPDYHGRDPGAAQRPMLCYSLLGARVSGDGNVWLRGQLLTAPDIMPDYVAASLGLAEGGHDRLRAEAQLPVRHIDRPCLIATGHGVSVYGHFLIEILFRILVARAAFANTGLSFQYLLPVQTPGWLLRILDQHLGIPRETIAFFDPTIEQVELRHAILPARVLQPGGFHPGVNAMIDQLIGVLDLGALAPTPPRVFAMRRGFHNPAAPYRVCLNEERLLDIAAKRHGFVPVTTEQLTWAEQIALFQRADIVVGLAGSGLHNAIFAKPDSRLASLGVMNDVQSDIGTLRRQHNAFLDPGQDMLGTFSIDEDRFTAFLDAVCNWPGKPAPPAAF